MELQPITKKSNPISITELVPTHYKNITEYYDEAGPDYAAWSKNFNMHFGYCKHWTDIFSLEKMLVRMNTIVLEKLAIPATQKCLIADLGCGVGAVARHTATKFPLCKVKAITISDYQINKGKQVNNAANLAHRVEMVKDNFENLHYTNNYFDYAYAVESACHSHDADKELFIAEMARTLKAGGRFCIADGFLKHDKKLPWLFQKIYNKIVDCWALPCFGDLTKFTQKLKEYGLSEIEVKEISYRIAPSVAYVPFVCLKFFTKEIWKNRSLKMNKQRWNNVYGPVLGMFLGLYRKDFGYYIISGKKKN